MLPARDVSGLLEENHYLGPSRRGVAYRDECGVDREEILRVKDSSLVRRMPWASYVEPKWKKGRHRGGGADYKRFLFHQRKKTAETSPPVVD